MFVPSGNFFLAKQTNDEKNFAARSNNVRTWNFFELLVYINAIAVQRIYNRKIF